MRRAELVEGASGGPSGSPGAGPSTRTGRRRGGASLVGSRGGGGGGRGGKGGVLHGMAQDGSGGTGSSNNDSPRRWSVGAPAAVGKGKGRARTGAAAAAVGAATAAAAATATNASSSAAAAESANGGGGGGNSRGNGRGRNGSLARRNSAGGVGERSHSGRGLGTVRDGGGLEGAGEGEGPGNQDEEEEEEEQGEAGPTKEEAARAACIDNLKKLTKSCLEENMPDTAAYYADKLATFSGFEREAVLLLAKAQFACGGYLRAVNLLAQHRLLDYADNFGLRVCHLAARSLRAAERTEESVSLLERVLGQTDAHTEEVKRRAKAARLGNVAGGPPNPSGFLGKPGGISGAREGEGGVGEEAPSPGVDVFAALCCLRGQAYAALDNRRRAALWLKTALEIDSRCVEALQCLTRGHLLSIEEQASMVSKLEYDQPTEESWLHFLFKSQLNKPPGSRSQVFGDLGRVGLGGNLDVLAAKAECCYEENDAQQALNICRQVLRTDPHNDACLPVYLAAMVELKMKSQLFYAAHQLVEAGPKKAVSWFAVGCYYHLLSKNDLAQRYFLKSTKLDGKFAPAWIGFGNAFAAQEETDQAVSAYRTAARLFQGSHLALLYIGMEYVRTHNLALARNFLMGALSLSPSDPLVLNELGVVHLATGEYLEARDRFSKVLDIVQGLSSQALEAWESTVFNLGHCHRKLGDLDEAASCYMRARELAPDRHSVHSALALTCHLQGRHDDAIAGYHRALGLKPDDSFAAEMLKKALHESFSGDEPCAGLTDLLSKTTISSNASPEPNANANPKSNSDHPPGMNYSAQPDTTPGDNTTTPGFRRRGLGPDGGGVGDGGGSEYSARMGDGGDGLLSYGGETPRTPRDNNAAAYARGVPDSGQMWEEWRREGGEGSGDDDEPGSAVDFSTPATVDRRRGARAGARARGEQGGGLFDGLGGGSSFGSMGASGSHG